MYKRKRRGEEGAKARKTSTRAYFHRSQQQQQQQTREARWKGKGRPLIPAPAFYHVTILFDSAMVLLSISFFLPPKHNHPLWRDTLWLSPWVLPAYPYTRWSFPSLAGKKGQMLGTCWVAVTSPHRTIDPQSCYSAFSFSLPRAARQHTCTMLAIALSVYNPLKKNLRSPVSLSSFIDTLLCAWEGIRVGSVMLQNSYKRKKKKLFIPVEIGNWKALWSNDWWRSLVCHDETRECEAVFRRTGIKKWLLRACAIETIFIDTLNFRFYDKTTSICPRRNNNWVSSTNYNEIPS